MPYRGNRGVIFDSQLLHQTDMVRFREGYENRRINVSVAVWRARVAWSRKEYRQILGRPAPSLPRYARDSARSWASRTECAETGNVGRLYPARGPGGRRSAIIVLPAGAGPGNCRSVPGTGDEQQLPIGVAHLNCSGLMAAFPQHIAPHLLRRLDRLQIGISVRGTRMPSVSGTCFVTLAKVEKEKGHL